MGKLFDQYKQINFPADKNKPLQLATQPDPIYQNLHKSWPDLTHASTRPMDISHL